MSPLAIAREGLCKAGRRPECVWYALSQTACRNSFKTAKVQCLWRQSPAKTPLQGIFCPGTKSAKEKTLTMSGVLHVSFAQGQDCRSVR